MTVQRDFATAVFGVACALFIGLMLLQDAGLAPPSLYLPYLSFTLPLLAALAMARWRPEEESSIRMAHVGVAAAFVLAVALRLGLSLQHPVLLGYDAGLYKHTLDTYATALPRMPEADLPQWVRHVYPQGLPALATALRVLAGVDAEELMRYVFPVLSAALVFPLYLVGRDAFGARSGLIAAFLYALSYTHLFTFGLIYLKNVFGLFLLLLAFHALQRGRYALFGVLLGGVGVYHRPTFLVGVLAVGLYWLLTRRRDVLAGVAIAAAIALPLYLLRWEENWGLVAEGLGLRDSTSNAALGEGGTFIEVGEYVWVSLGYHAFAIIAAVQLILRRAWVPPLLLLVVCAGLVAFQAFFFRRHLIPLDLAVLLLAGKGISLAFFEARPWRAPVLSVLLVGGLFLVVAAPSLVYASEVAPLIGERELNVVRWLEDGTPPEAVVVSSAYDAPWVAGWSGREPVAPGLFDDATYSREEWLAFLDGTEPAEAAAFLAAYGPVVYVYHSGRPASYMALEKFQPPYFELVHADGEARVFAMTTATAEGG